MKRPLKPEDRHIWGVVAATVHPLPGRSAPETPSPNGEGQANPPPLGVDREATGGRIVKRSGGTAKAGKRGSRADLSTPAHISPPVSRPLATLPIRGGNDSEKGIEPNRRHRISKERDPIGARLDLHGYDQDRARAALERFLARAWDEGYRAVLVITGKGVQGDGVLKRRAPEWLGAPHLAHIVAGLSDAARHHGGEGALYVALKRKPRT